jgi:hypothetical protein
VRAAAVQDLDLGLSNLGLPRPSAACPDLTSPVLRDRREGVPEGLEQEGAEFAEFGSKEINSLLPRRPLVERLLLCVASSELGFRPPCTARTRPEAAARQLDNSSAPDRLAKARIRNFSQRQKLRKETNRADLPRSSPAAPSAVSVRSIRQRALDQSPNPKRSVHDFGPDE